MKKLALYHIGALILLMSNSALAVKFDIKKGFVYEEKELEAQKQAEIEKKISQPFVRVLRLFNEDNKISDPVLQVEGSGSEDIQFLTIDDSTSSANEPGQIPEQREIASLSSTNLNWFVIEKSLLELESQFGIRSMPVVQFTKKENLDKRSFAHRVEFLETKLGIQPDSTKIAAIPQRLVTIKQKLNVETETLGLDINF